MTIKIPNLAVLAAGLRKTFVMYRFPLAAAFACSALAVYFIEAEIEDDFNEIMALALAIPILASIAVAAKQWLWTEKKILAANFAAIIFLLAYYLALPDKIFESPEIFAVRFFMWMAGFFLAATFVPFLEKWRSDLMDSFWYYNDRLARSLFVAGIWTATLQIGISVAMASVDFLFGIDIDPKRYAELFCLLAGVFGTTFFFSRMVEPFRGNDTKSGYSVELKMFAQYVLIGLALVYFVILYSYDFKILITGDWPKGALAEMIIGFSFFGIIGYIALYPLMKTAAWISRFGKFLFAAILPQTGMLFWALSFRLKDYGFTENRYFVFVFGLWLFVLSIYFLVSKRKDLRIIPLTAFLIALFTSFGPWGAFAVSERSQIGRLDKILATNGRLSQGKISPSENRVGEQDAKEISAIIDYLNNVHGLDGIQDKFSQPLPIAEEPDLATEKIEISRWDIPRMVVEDYMGIEYKGFNYQPASADFGHFYVFADANEQVQNPLDISDYEYLADFNGNSQEALIKSDKYIFGFAGQDAIFSMKKNSREITSQDLAEFVKNLVSNQGSESAKSEPRPRKEMMLAWETPAGRFVLLFESLEGSNVHSQPVVTSATGRILWKEK